MVSKPRYTQVKCLRRPEESLRGSLGSASFDGVKEFPAEKAAETPWGFLSCAFHLGPCEDPEDARGGPITLVSTMAVGPLRSLPYFTAAAAATATARERSCFNCFRVSFRASKEWVSPGILRPSLAARGGAPCSAILAVLSAAADASSSSSYSAIFSAAADTSSRSSNNNSAGAEKPRPKRTPFLHPPALCPPRFQHQQQLQQQKQQQQQHQEEKQRVYLNPAVQGVRKRESPRKRVAAAAATGRKPAAAAAAAARHHRPSRAVRASRKERSSQETAAPPAAAVEPSAASADTPGDPWQAAAEEQQLATSSSSSSSSSKVDLCRALRASLSSQGLRTLTEVQRRAFPPILSGRSVLIRSPTGTGKTLAYVLPLLQRLQQHEWPREEPILILTPTRELAEQVAAQFYRFRGSIDCHVVVAVGGSKGGPPLGPVLLQRQGAHVVIGTPGRVLSLAAAGELLHLQQLQCLVLDEADKLVGPSFEEPLKDLLPQLNPKRQTLLVSATMSRWLSQQIQDAFSTPQQQQQHQQQQQQEQQQQQQEEQEEQQEQQQHDEETVVIDLSVSSGSQVSSSVSHFAARVPRAVAERTRRAALLVLQRLPPGGQCVIFCCSRHEVSLLAAHPLLQQQQARSLHAAMPQQQRRQIVSLFRDKQFSILVASDVAARGLDFPGVRLVLQWGPPLSPEVYIHRAGRTGRAGEEGEVVVLYDEAQRRQLRRLESQLKIQLQHLKMPTEEEMKKVLLDRLEEEIVAFPVGADSGPLLSYASSQWQQWGPRLLAAGLALLLQRQQRISWVSCLSGKQNYVALLFYDPLGRVLRTRSELLQLLREALSQRQLSQIGRIALTKRGFAADMPPAVAAHLKVSPQVKQMGLKLLFLSSLPPVVQQQHVLRHELERRAAQRRRGSPLAHAASPKARRRAARRLARQQEAKEIRATLRQRLQQEKRRGEDSSSASPSSSSSRSSSGVEPP